jgi:hypothetical protein
MNLSTRDYEPQVLKGNYKISKVRKSIVKIRPLNRPQVLLITCFFAVNNFASSLDRHDYEQENIAEILPFVAPTTESRYKEWDYQFGQ